MPEDDSTAPEMPEIEPASDTETAAQDKPVAMQDTGTKPNADPEFLQAWETKLRAIPLWLVLVGALAVGLAAGGVIYIVRSVLAPLFAGTP